MLQLVAYVAALDARCSGRAAAVSVISRVGPAPLCMAAQDRSQFLENVRAETKAFIEEQKAQQAAENQAALDKQLKDGAESIAKEQRALQEERARLEAAERLAKSAVPMTPSTTLALTSVSAGLGLFLLRSAAMTRAAEERAATADVSADAAEAKSAALSRRTALTVFTLTAAALLAPSPLSQPLSPPSPSTPSAPPSPPTLSTSQAISAPPSSSSSAVSASTAEGVPTEQAVLAALSSGAIGFAAGRAGNTSANVEAEAGTTSASAGAPSIADAESGTQTEAVDVAEQTLALERATARETALGAELAAAKAEREQAVGDATAELASTRAEVQRLEAELLRATEESSEARAGATESAAAPDEVQQLYGALQQRQMRDVERKLFGARAGVAVVPASSPSSDAAPGEPQQGRVRKWLGSLSGTAGRIIGRRSGQKGKVRTWLGTFAQAARRRVARRRKLDSGEESK